MLLYLADNDPSNNWRKIANDKVLSFIKKPHMRDRKATPNLGW
jgi:hypothetical protein